MVVLEHPRDGFLIVIHPNMFHLWNHDFADATLGPPKHQLAQRHDANEPLLGVNDIQIGDALVCITVGNPADLL